MSCTRISGAANSGAMSSPWYFTSGGRYRRRSPLRDPMSSTALPGLTRASAVALRKRIRSSPELRQLWRGSPEIALQSTTPQGELAERSVALLCVRKQKQQEERGEKCPHHGARGRIAAARST